LHAVVAVLRFRARNLEIEKQHREKVMTRYWAIGLLTVGLLPLPWSAVAAPQKDPKADAPYRFVGYSSSEEADLVTGEFGLPPLYAACQDLTGFGPAARMCTTEEFMTSPNIDVPTATNAWISPTIIGFDGTTAVDFSGVEASPDLFICLGPNGNWTSNTIRVG